MIELVWAELKRYLRKKFLTSKQEIANRVQKFFSEVLTIEKCRTYIGRVQEVRNRILSRILFFFNYLVGFEKDFALINFLIKILY